MRLTLLGTSSLDYPSPRGRWLPLAAELVRQGHTVTLLLLHHAYDQLPVRQRRELTEGVMVHYVGQMHVYGPVGQRRYFGAGELLRVALSGVAQLAVAAVRTGGDALHVCKPQPINGLAGWLAARALRRPCYVDCDDYEAGGNRFGAAWQQPVVRWWEDRLPQHAAGVTVNTRFLQERYAALGVPRSRIAYVPNGISDAQLAAPVPRQVAGARAALGLDDAPVIAYVGTLSQTTHDVGLLIDAFAIARRQLPDARLLLIGDGEDRLALMGKVRELGLGEQVRFVGAVPHRSVPAFLANAACSVDPVGDDAVARARSPLKIVESLALGVPVVTGAVGDRTEMVGDGAGLLVQPGDAAALADGLVTMLRDRQLRAASAARARERAQAYRWRALAERWTTIYR